MIKLIVSDIDGTLIRNGMVDIDPRMYDLIREMKRQGILFIGASGRPYNSLTQVFKPFRHDIGYISESGPIGIYKDEMFYDKPLDRGCVESVVHDIRSRKGGNILYSQVDSTYLETPPGSRYHIYMSRQLKYPSYLVHDLLALKEPCYKVASCNFDGFDVDLDFYREKYGNDYTVVASGDYWVDVIPKDVNKGTCLQAFMEKFGIAPDECLAFGDQENDLAMLKLAEHAYAMNTSMDHVKEAAGAFTDCPEDVIEAVLKEQA